MKKEFTTKKELFDFLIENKQELIAEKKFKMKQADAVSFIFPHVKNEANKEASTAELLSKDKIQVKAIINTTGLLDSHNDVHIKGIWKKTLKENKNLYHLQEHQMKFDKVISDKVKAYTDNITWKDLGFNFEGSTEALVFDSEISKERNQFMFEQYAKKYVKNHSVGMQYVNLFLCINDEDYKEENDNWNKYISHVANKEIAEERGYFWAITEAKALEGSAVLFGSNYATPTQEVTPIDKGKPSEDTTVEPQNNALGLFEKLAKL
jgi:hypothetical protein